MFMVVLYDINIFVVCFHYISYLLTFVILYGLAKSSPFLVYFICYKVYKITGKIGNITLPVIYQ